MKKPNHPPVHIPPAGRFGFIIPLIPNFFNIPKINSKYYFIANVFMKIVSGAAIRPNSKTRFAIAVTHPAPPAYYGGDGGNRRKKSRRQQIMCNGFGNNWWWIIILLLLFGNGNTCGCDNGCGCDNNNCGCGNNWWWIIILALLGVFGENGLGCGCDNNSCGCGNNNTCGCGC